jgi:hypothetical protein
MKLFNQVRRTVYVLAICFTAVSLIWLGSLAAQYPMDEAIHWWGPDFIHCTQWLIMTLILWGITLLVYFRVVVIFIITETARVIKYIRTGKY